MSQSTRLYYIGYKVLSEHFNTAPFCSMAQTAAHLLILRLTFYIPYHSLLVFMYYVISSFFNTRHPKHYNKLEYRIVTLRPRGYSMNTLD